MASNIVKMILRLDDQASPSLNQVGNTATTTGNKFSSMAKKGGVAAAALTGLALAAKSAYSGLISLGQSVADIGNQFGDAAVVTGLSVETLETFDFMARATGSSLQKLERGFYRFNVGLSEAQTGTGELASIFERLDERVGFNIDSFNDTEEALFGYIDALQRTGDESFIAEGMSRAFGKAAIDLNKALSTGDIENYDQVLNSVGRVTGPAAIASTQEMQKAIALQEIVFRRMKLAIFETFMGENGFTKTIAVSIGTLRAFGAAIDQIFNMIEGLGKAIIALMTAIQRIPEAIAAGNFSSVEDAMEDFAEASQLGVEEGFNAFLRGDWINEGFKAAEAYRDNLQTLMGGAENQLADAEALAAALGNLEKVSEEAGETNERAGANVDRTSAKLREQQREVEQLRRQWLEYMDFMNEREAQTYAYANALQFLNEQAEGPSTLTVIDGSVGQTYDEFFENLTRNLEELDQREYSEMLFGRDAVNQIASNLDEVTAKWESSIASWREASKEWAYNQRSIYSDQNPAMPAAPGMEDITSQLRTAFIGMGYEEGSFSLGQRMDDTFYELFYTWESAMRTTEGGLEQSAQAYADATAVLNQGQPDLSRSAMADIFNDAEALQDQLGAYQGESKRLAQLMQSQASALVQLETQIASTLQAVADGILDPQAAKELLNQLGATYERVNSDLAATSDQLKSMEVNVDIAEGQVENLRVGQVDAEKLNSVVSNIGGIATDVASGNIAGAAGTIANIAGASPLVGGVITAIGAVAEIGTMTVKEIKNNTKSFVKNLEKGIQVIAEAFPAVIQHLLANLPVAITEAAFTWIPLLVLELPLAIMKGVVDGFRSIISFIVESIRNAFSLFGGGDDDRRTGIRVEPKEYYTGVAKVNKTGLAVLHRGETVIQANGRPSQSQQSRVGSGSVNVNISTAILDRDVIPRLVREIDRVTGSYGRTTANFAGS